ncbi:MAG: BamA/TamA family outer membrane protein [Bacteroidota bacterium]|nr:BamA/TamA family outer membrane protein [Bacteroidota bacterium]
MKKQKPGNHLLFCFIWVLGIFCGIFSWKQAIAQEQPSDTVKGYSITKEKIKKGWNLGALPIVGYNTDIGFQYGAFANIYHYGDGSWYPKYFHSIYVEVSRTTKGGGINQIFYDSEKLIPHIRVTADATYLTERALDFYGFNGYKSVYNHSWENQDNKTSYKSRVFYRDERLLFRFALSFQGKFLTPKMRWLAGFTVCNAQMDSVDVDRLNKGKKESDKLPHIKGLYGNYVDWGIIKPDEAKGGMNNFFKLGLIYDSRDNEPNPQKGIWSEIVFQMAPEFLSNNSYGFIKAAVIHRQYFTLIKERLSFAYRLAYQGTIAGKVPYYMQPIMLNSFELTTTIDGLGGSRNLRGILRDRVVGDGIAYGNAEFRWKFYHFRLFRQNFYMALNTFADAGMVVQEIPVDKSRIPSNLVNEYFSDTPEYPHLCIGAGYRIAMNQNFIICCDYGQVVDKRDGSSGVYVGFGYLF